jgi:hypothetical protein
MGIVRGITLWQPYATLVAVGVKSIETRSWGTDFRGRLAIHAAKRWNAAQMIACEQAEDELRPVLFLGYPWRELLGCIVAICTLADVRCVPLEGWRPGIDAPHDDFRWGDLSPGRYAWVLTDVRLVTPPIPCRGMQGLWEVPPDVAAQLEGV